MVTKAKKTNTRKSTNRPKHSGFEVPAYGTIVKAPKGMKRVVDSNGVGRWVKDTKK